MMKFSKKESFQIHRKELQFGGKKDKTHERKERKK